MILLLNVFKWQFWSESDLFITKQWSFWRCILRHYKALLQFVFKLLDKEAALRMLVTYFSMNQGWVSNNDDTSLSVTKSVIAPFTSFICLIANKFEHESYLRVIYCLYILLYFRTLRWQLNAMLEHNNFNRPSHGSQKFFWNPTVQRTAASVLAWCKICKSAFIKSKV